MFLQVHSERSPIQPPTIFKIGDFPVTNSMLMAFSITILFLLVSLFIKYKISTKKIGKVKIIAELLVTFFVNLISQITGNKEKAEKILPIIGALFLFIGVSNFIGLIPGTTAFIYNDNPLFRIPTSDFNTTFTLALSMVILTHIVSLKGFGLLGHFGKFFKFRGVYEGFRKGLSTGLMSVVEFIIGLMDIISEFAKIISLSLRLFGNMYAGEILTAILFGFLAIILPLPWLAMSMLVAVIQAVVFGSLVAAYYTAAVDGAEEV